MPLVVYSLLRIGLFAVLALVLYWAGLRDWLLVLVAAVLAFVLSYLLLRGPRDASARWLAERAGRAAAGDPGARGFTREAVADADLEDAAVDAGLGGRSSAAVQTERADVTERAEAVAAAEAPETAGPGSGQSASPPPSSRP